MKNRFIFTLALLLGIHGPLFANTEVLKGSSKDISKHGRSVTVQKDTQVVSELKNTFCGKKFTPYQRGVASWYGPGFHGKLMANQETFDMWKDTVAHPTLKFGTKVCIRNNENGKMVIATVTDRGGFEKYNRIIDVSKGVASKLEFSGLANVSVMIYRG